jgi:predicted Zn-ribbon and HTH transcriptional regulator
MDQKRSAEMSMPYRDEQILRILSEDTDGLTTAQIVERARKMPANELPDSNVTSQRLYGLRNTKQPKISSTDTAKGRVHKITAAGRKALEAEVGDTRSNAAKKDKSPGNDIATQPAAKGIETQETSPCKCPACAPELVTAPKTVDQNLDNLLDQIRGLVGAKPIKIRDKGRKIAAFEQLEKVPFFTQDFVDILIAIRADIEQMEAE